MAVYYGGRGEEGPRGAYAPPLNHPGERLAWQGGGGWSLAGAMLCSCNLHSTASKPYVDQEMDISTFYITQDREKPTDSA